MLIGISKGKAFQQLWRISHGLGRVNGPFSQKGKLSNRTPQREKLHMQNMGGKNCPEQTDSGMDSENREVLHSIQSQTSSAIKQ